MQRLPFPLHLLSCCSRFPSMSLASLCLRRAPHFSFLLSNVSGMYTARLYSALGSNGGGGGGGGEGKAGRRPGLVGGALPMLENHHSYQTHLLHPHHHLPHHQHPHRPPTTAPTTSYLPFYHESPRGPHYHNHHHHHYHMHMQASHLAPPPPPPPPYYQPRLHLHSYASSTGAGSASGRKKRWNFIHEKMSYDTFFTMKRLIERSRQLDEVLRWVTQNPEKISHNHYPIALQKMGQLLQAGTGPDVSPLASSSPSPTGGSGGAERREILKHQDFQILCNAIVNNCTKFDNFSIVNCLYAVAALGLSSDSRVVLVLEAESQARLGQFNQKDISMVFSSSMKLHPASQHPLTEACLACLEKNLERERHPQTLFLLLSYYRLKWQALQVQDGASNPNPEQLQNNRKILRLVKHTLANVSGVRDQEMALLDEMLAACAQEASNKSLELIFSSHLFYQNRQEKFVCSLAEVLSKKVDSITPYTMALVAKYIARHRLRDTRLLDTIADFVVKKGEHLDSKVIQKLVFPFSRMSYRPSNEAPFFSRLELVLELKALSSPLATVNILMSLFQLGHFPSRVLHRVFSSAFISNVTNSPYALIVRRYLSLLDSAVELEYSDYTGPRLQDTHKVLMFDHALTADEVNRKYSYKGLVAEALRQLVGHHGYKQDVVLPPGYNTDFLLWIDESGRVLPIRTELGLSVEGVSAACGTSTSTAASKSTEAAVSAITSDFHKFSPFALLKERGAEQPVSDDGVGGSEAFVPQHMRASQGIPSPLASRVVANGDGPLDCNLYYVPVSTYYSGLAKESQESSTLGFSSSEASGAREPAVPDSLFQFSIGNILEDEVGSGAGGNKKMGCELPGFYAEAYPEGADGEDGAALSLHPNQANPPDLQSLTVERRVKRVIMSVNDKWHYCHNSDVLVGSRAMRDRHLHLLGYVILQLPYHELEKLNGIEQVKQYLHKKLLDVPL
ncbi:fas-activated serine/threonine kinase [Aplochiton taeniatus]